MDKNRWTKIDPDYLPEDVRAARDKMLASREAFKQSEALLKAEGLFHRDKSVSKKTAAKLHVRTA